MHIMIFVFLKYILLYIYFKNKIYGPIIPQIMENDRQYRNGRIFYLSRV